MLLVWFAFLALQTRIPGVPSQKKVILFERSQTITPFAKASLDHLILAQPGLIPQISGKLTCMQINGATIFVDLHSDHVYVFLMQDLTLDETILAKHTYEQFLSLIGVTSKAYHAMTVLLAIKS